MLRTNKDLSAVSGQPCAFARYQIWRTLLTNVSWTVNQENYPSGGEIDIIEGINEANINTETLHTDSGCNIVRADQGGNMQGDGYCDNNYSHPPSQYANQGCSVIDSSAANSPSYGNDFNNIGGGVYAMVSI
jgi:hypothetical protein